MVAFCPTSEVIQRSNQLWLTVYFKTTQAPCLTALVAFAAFSTPKATFTQYFRQLVIPFALCAQTSLS